MPPMINGQYMGYADGYMDSESGAYDPTLTEDEEMPATERDLADDAPWKQIQKNTFTRWANEHLKKVKKTIENLEYDLADGLKLIALIEILSQKHVGRYNKRPNFRAMKLENVAMALRFLEKERIKLVSIDAGAIVDGNLKLILGLIWTLILHYSISMPMYDDNMDEDEWNKQTPKQKLLGWIQNKVPQLPITNFGKDWHDGKALGALVDNCAPGLCPDWPEWDPNENLGNATTAMDLAEEHLDVAQIITPAEITNPYCDEQSVMTYLSQFPNATLKPGWAPPKREPLCDPSKVSAYGPGLQANGLTVEDEAVFNIDVSKAGVGELMVHLTGPSDHSMELRPEMVPNQEGVLQCRYYPQDAGRYQIHILFGGKEIPASPYVVNVEDLPPDPSKVMARGPGLEKSGVIARERTYFEIFINGAGGTGNELEVAIYDLTTKTEIQYQTTQVGECQFRVEYIPSNGGPHEVHINYGGPINNSPYSIDVELPLDASKVWAEGPGLSSATGILSGQAGNFTVYTQNAGRGHLNINIITASGQQSPANIVDNNDGSYSVEYFTMEHGLYTIDVTYGGTRIPGAPFKVEILKAPDASQVRVYGPGVNVREMRTSSYQEESYWGWVFFFYATLSDTHSLTHIQIHKSPIPTNSFHIEKFIYSLETNTSDHLQ